MRIQFIEGVRLLFLRMNGSPETVEDGFHLVRDLGVGRAVHGILQKPTSEDGVSEERRFALVLRFDITDALTSGIIRQGPLVWRRAKRGRRRGWPERERAALLLIDVVDRVCRGFTLSLLVITQLAHLLAEIVDFPRYRIQLGITEWTSARCSV